MPASRRIAHYVLDGTHLVEDRPSGDQKGAPQPALPALDMHLPVPAGTYDLRQCTRIVAIGFVRHRLQRRVGLSVSMQDRRQPFGAQPVVKPGCQQTGLQPDPLQRQINSP